MKTLREACLERGIDPDRIPFQGTKQKWLALDRIIPGVPDRISPSEQLRKLGRESRAGNARRMYTRQSAANDQQLVDEGGMAAYLAAFHRLNNLKEAS